MRLQKIKREATGTEGLILTVSDVKNPSSSGALVKHVFIPFFLFSARQRIRESFGETPFYYVTQTEGSSDSCQRLSGFGRT